jgi:ACS family allantoate permease-like MFS transporter
MITLFEIITMIGGIILWTVPRTNIAAILVGYYLMSCFAGMYGMTLLTAGTNTAGHTKKSTVGAVVVLGYCLGNIMAPLIFVAQQAPGYVGGFTGVTICTVYAGIASQLARLILVRRNKNRQEELGDPVFDDAFTDKTDHQNKNFRYLL